MFAAPVGRVAYWVARSGRLQRVPANVLSSARRTSKAWRSWGNRFAGVVGRTLGAGAVVGASGLGISKMPMKRKASYAARKRASARAMGYKRRRVSKMPRQALPYRLAAQRRSRPTKAAAAGAIRTRIKKQTKLRNKRRINTALQVPYIIQRHQGITPEVADRDPDDVTIDYPGYYPMARGLPTDIPVNQPVMCMHLTGYFQTGTNPGDMFRVQMSQTGIPIFGIQTCQNNTGGNITSAWQSEDGRHNSAGATKLMQHMWYDIRMKLWGARKQPVTYDIHLV